MTDIMHAHVKGPDLADPTGAKEEQLYVCRSAPPTPRVLPKRPRRDHKGKPMQVGPASKSYPRLRGPRARKRRGGQRCVLLKLWNTSFDVAPSPSSSLRRSITLESGAASRGHVDLGLGRRWLVRLALVRRRVHDGGAVFLERERPRILVNRSAGLFSVGTWLTLTMDAPRSSLILKSLRSA